MTKKNSLIILIPLTIVSILFVANPGNHFTSMECDYKFFFSKPKYDVARYCLEEEIVEMTPRQELVNKLLLTNSIHKLKTELTN